MKRNLSYLHLCVGGTVHRSCYLEQESMVQELTCGLLAVYLPNCFSGWVTSVKLFQIFSCFCSLCKLIYHGQ